MQNTFMELRASAQECIQKNDEVRMGEVVNTLTERFLALAKGALRSDGGESLGEEDHTDEHSRGGRSERPKSRDDEGPTSGGNTGKNMSPPTWGGYQLSYTRDSQHEQRYPDGPAGSTTRGMGEYENVGHDDRSFNAYIDQQVLDMDMYSSPPSLPMEMEHFCYSYQETSFSRRLHRACLESAYHLLTSPTASQEDIGRTFAYTFCYASKQDVLNTVTRLLRAGNNESLSPRDYPELVQIPSRPLDYYDDIYQAYEDKARLDMLGQSNSEIREEAHRQLTKMGIDNKFLRPIDVEKLLVERGIIMETMDSTGSDHSSSPGSSQDSEYLSPSNLSVDSATSTETLFTPATKSEDPNSGTAGMKMMQGVKLSVDFDVLVKGEPLSLPTPISPQLPPLTPKIELIRHGVCLGQYPGFKPNDVEDAIRIASRAPVPDMVY